MEGSSGKTDGMGAKPARGSSRGSSTAVAAAGGSPAEQEGMQEVLQLRGEDTREE